jgi:pterin-4a-carbinolamine dehydratase
VRPLIPYLNCTKTNAKIVGLDLSDLIAMGWDIQNNRLAKSFSFENQTQLAEFFLKVAKHADETGHHPDISIFQCSKMKIELFTHDKNQITALDYALAEYIDSI